MNLQSRKLTRLKIVLFFLLVVTGSIVLGLWWNKPPLLAKSPDKITAQEGNSQGSDLSSSELSQQSNSPINLSDAVNSYSAMKEKNRNSPSPSPMSAEEVTSFRAFRLRHFQSRYPSAIYPTTKALMQAISAAENGNQESVQDIFKALTQCLEMPGFQKGYENSTRKLAERKGENGETLAENSIELVGLQISAEYFGTRNSTVSEMCRGVPKKLVDGRWIWQQQMAEQGDERAVLDYLNRPTFTSVSTGTDAAGLENYNHHALPMLNRLVDQGSLNATFDLLQVLVPKYLSKPATMNPNLVNAIPDEAASPVRIYTLIHAMRLAHNEQYMDWAYKAMRSGPLTQAQIADAERDAEVLANKIRQAQSQRRGG